MVCDRREQRPLLVGEGRVPVADELADLAALPAERQTLCVTAGATLRPDDPAVFEDDRGACRVDRDHRRLDDRRQRLLEVERLGHGLRDPAQRLELGHAALRVVVELGVLDRLRDLTGDRHEQVDLGVVVVARRDRADVQRALQLLLGQDRNREDRLVLLLVEVREALEARVEMSCSRDHDRRALGRRRSRDALARTHLRPPCRLLDPGADGGPQHELVRALVVEVDEAGVGLERLGHLRRDQLEQLVQVERRVDGLDRLGDEAQVPLGAIHALR